MTNPFADTLHLRVRPSAILKYLTLLLHASAAVIIATLAVYRPPMALLLPGIAIAGGYAWRRAGLHTPGAIVRLRCGGDGVWHWQTASGAWHEGQVTSAVCVGPHLVCLGLRPAQARLRVYSCALFSDALSEDGHRHLRARLTITRSRERTNLRARP